MESVKAELLKRKKITAHAWKSRFKRQRCQEIETELEGSDRPSHVCNNNNSIRIVPKPTVKTVAVNDQRIPGVAGIFRDKSITKSSDGPLEKLTSSFRGCDVKAVENDSNVDPNLKDKVVVKPPGRDGLEDLTINSASREILDDSESLPTSGSLVKNKGSPGPESITCLGGLQDGTLNSESHENETLFAKSESFDRLGTCSTCSKEKRMSCNAHDKELCSCDATVDIELNGSSASKKIASKGKGTEDAMNNDIMEVQRLCDKRMKKLIRKQQRATHKFHQVWEKEKSRLEIDCKLEATIIRCIFSEGSTRIGQLNLLDSNFKKKVEEMNLLKETQLNDLEVQHQAARSVERHKAANWLAEAKACCSSEQTAAVCGAQLLHSQSEEDGECSAAREHMVETMDTDATTQHVAVNNSSKAMSMQGNVVEPFDRTNHLSTGEIVCTDLPASEERVCNKMQPVDSNMGIPLDVPQIVDNVDPMELSNGSNRQDANAFADSLASQGGETDEPNTAGSPLAGEVSVPSEQREAPSNHCGSLPLQVLEDQVHGNLVSANPQDNSVPVLDGQRTLQIEVANYELDSAETHVQPHFEEQRFENCEQQHLESIHASPSHDPSPATEVECQTRDSGRNSSQTAEAVETLVLPPECLVSVNPQDGSLPVLEGQDTSQIEIANLELDHTGHHVQPHLEEQIFENCEQQHLVSTDASSNCNPSPATNVEHQTHDSGRNSSQAAEAEEAFMLPLESSPQIEGNNSLWYKNPLENELERLYKETEHFEQSFKDMIPRFKSECEKEIQETVAQIRSKYDAKIKDAETEFRLKKNDLHKNRDKVFMHKILADALALSYTDEAHWASGFSGTQQGILSNHMPHHHQPGPWVCQPPSNAQVQSPIPRPMQHVSMPHSTIHVNCQNIASPPVQAVHGTSSRPLVMNDINSARNPYLIGGNRSPAPHLQMAASSRPPAMYLSVSQPPQPLWPPPFPRQPILPPHQNQAAPQNGLTAFHNQSLSAANLVADVNTQPPTPPWYCTAPSLPEISSSFGSLDPSYWETVRNIQPSSASSDVICLLDDD